MSSGNSKWLKDIVGDLPFVIAGPCSAETEEQVMRIAQSVKDDHRIQGFRAGVWKPRTKPGSFEGVGPEALKWLQNVKKETGLLVGTEIANTEHVELALKHDIDILWIGARTTVSPFVVQEIADALKGTDKIVLVKNPVSPDLELWSGGLERLLKADIKKLGAIHRGFSAYYNTKFRNQPMWQIPIDLNDRFPDIPVICDPSHIAGKRDYLMEISQTSFDLNFDGLIIETHDDPDNAWSDPAQQVTPKTLKQILDDLMLRKKNFSANSQTLTQLRSEIDEIDSEVLHLLGNRMKRSIQIGEIKKAQNVSVLQKDRWHEVLERAIKDGTKLGLSESFIAELFKLIHQESIDYQKK